MLMTTSRLMLLRAFNLTLGRSALATHLLRRTLVQVLVRRPGQGQKYMASSRFFQFSELD